MRVYIGVGSNIRPRRNIGRAMRRLARLAAVTASSTFYRTEPEAYRKQARYLNGVWEVETDLRPKELKQVFREIEASLGRRRSGDKYASRPIDLDILIYGDLVIDNDELTLPDPHIESRAFVSLPLLELAPELVLPGSGTPIREIAAAAEKGSMEPDSKLTHRLRRSLKHESRESSRAHPGTTG